MRGYLRIEPLGVDVTNVVDFILVAVVAAGIFAAAAASRAALSRFADFNGWPPHKLEKARRQSHRRPSRECAHLSLAVLTRSGATDLVVEHIRGQHCIVCLDLLAIQHIRYASELAAAADVPVFWTERPGPTERIDPATNTVVVDVSNGDWPIFRVVRHILDDDATGDPTAALQFASSIVSDTAHFEVRDRALALLRMLTLSTSNDDLETNGVAYDRVAQLGLGCAVQELGGLAHSYGGFLGPAKSRARAIGESLDEVGGMALMRRAHEHVAASNESRPYLARELDVAWDGVGEWLG